MNHPTKVTDANNDKKYQSYKQRKRHIFFYRLTRQNALDKPIAVLIFLLIFLLQENSKHHCQARKSIPRSINSVFNPDYLYLPENDDNAIDTHTYHLWNPSPKIDPDGFLTESYLRMPGSWEVPTQITGKHGPRNSRRLLTSPVIVRQVPGDGNCLFHSLSVALSAIEDRTHLDMKWRPNRSTRGGAINSRNENRLWNKRRRVCMSLHERSHALRQQAIDALLPGDSVHKHNENNDMPKKTHSRRNRRSRDRLFFLQGNEYLPASELLDFVASQYGLNGQEYCDYMKRDGYWGGGPEIVALCNVLKRPIHVYELVSTKLESREEQTFSTKKTKGIHADSNSSDDSDTSIASFYLNIWKRGMNILLKNDNKRTEFRLRRMACFGSPKFDYKEALHILSADSRFPDLNPGQESQSGNHFLAMFPKGTSGWRKYHTSIASSSLPLSKSRFRFHLSFRGSDGHTDDKLQSQAKKASTSTDGGDKRKGRNYKEYKRNKAQQKDSQANTLSRLARVVIGCSDTFKYTISKR